MVGIEYHSNVAMVKLERGVTNSMNLQFVQELRELFRSMADNGDIRSLILASANDKFFSIGFDIPHLFPLPKDEFLTFYQAFNRLCLDLFTIPKPVLAGITGHAVAGGCILALCCDYRYIAEGHRLMGLNEIKLGVPVPYPADCILRQLIGLRQARNVMYGGEFYPPEDARRIGLVDKVLPLEQVLPEALKKAAALGEHPQEALALIKRNRVEAVTREIQPRLGEKEQLFVERWYAKDTRERLLAAMEKF
jgi:enoyl-CoA hydratase/carnithine racemase